MMNAATKNDLTRWFYAGVVDGYKRMVIWCDTFDYSDYPEYTNLTGDDLREMVGKENGKNMKSLMEVYDLTMDIDDQMNVRRAYNY